MEDFNLAELIYQFSNAFIGEKWVVCEYDPYFQTEIRTYRLMYSKHIDYIKGYRSKTIDSYTARSMGSRLGKDYNRNRFLRNLFKVHAEEKGFYHRNFKVFRSYYKPRYPSSKGHRWYKNQYLVKIADGHFVKFSKTNVIYHYFGSNNRNKKGNKAGDSHGKRFYGAKVQYGTWFYDIHPGHFDIRRDWVKLLNNYLNYISQ